jgi:hypothetical protein
MTHVTAVRSRTLTTETPIPSMREWKLSSDLKEFDVASGV